MSVARAEPCRECGSPLAADQRYCLVCGARVGPHHPSQAALMARAGEYAAPATAAAAAGASRAKPRRRPLLLPSPRVSAVLVMAFLGFGTVIGEAATPQLDATLAASRGLKLELPAKTATASTAVTPPANPEAAEPPESEAQPTPEAASATASTPAKAPASTNTTETTTKTETKAAKPAVPKIKHVFVVMLSNQPYASTFGPASQAHYLTGTLERQGTLLVQFDAVAHEQLPDEIALLSGQGPTAETAANCPTYGELLATGTGPDEQVLGNGCVYPASTQTLPAQLTAKHLTWRAYVQGVAEPGSPTKACTHPALGQPDPTAPTSASSGPYATFRNPFVYFQSLSTPCATNEVGVNRLATDLEGTSAPSFAYIVPDRCDDGNPTPCTAGAPAGLAPADAFLSKVVPEILGSAAYKDDGLLVITTDEAPSSGEFADSSSCCGQPAFPNVPPAPGGLSPRGGGAVGALVLAPSITKASTNQERYNDFSLLRTIEDAFGLTHLGYAALPAVKSFEPAVFVPSEG